MTNDYCVRCKNEIPKDAKGVLCPDCVKVATDEGDGTEYPKVKTTSKEGTNIDYNSTPDGKSSNLGKDPAPTGHEQEEPRHGQS